MVAAKRWGWMLALPVAAALLFGGTPTAWAQTHEHKHGGGHGSGGWHGGGGHGGGWYGGYWGGPYWGWGWPYYYGYGYPYYYPYGYPYDYGAYSPDAGAAPPAYPAPTPDYGAAPPAYQASPPAPVAPQTTATWYYCSNPGGYYPYVQTCNGPWRAVPAVPPDMQ